MQRPPATKVTNVTASPSGEQHELRHGQYRATVVEVGGGIRTLELDGEPLLQGYAAGAVCDGARGQLLLPWPNRVEDGTYHFGGEERRLALTEPATNCAIHGLTRWANWTLKDRGADQVTLSHRLHPRPGWPGTLELEVTYTLADDGLTVAVTAVNAGSDPAPYGAGAHPYLVAGSPPVDGWELTLPAATFVHTDDRGLPLDRTPVDGTEYDFRSGRIIGEIQLDNPFTDLARDADGRCWVHLRDPQGRGREVSLWADARHGWLQVFTGDHLGDPDRRRTAVAVEPMTCPPNAFATGEDLLVLEPGESVTVRWGVQAR